MQPTQIATIIESLGKAYIFADLDNSLIFSDPGQDGTNLHQVCTDFEGKPNAFVNDKQLHFLRCLIAMGELVPTTARSTKSFNLVSLPSFNGYAIVSHGAIILTPDGTPENRWLKRTQALAVQEEESFARLLESLTAHSRDLGLEASERIVRDCELPIFLKASVSKDSGIQLGPLLNRVREDLPLPGWRFSDHEYYIEIVPPYARKGLAVQWFLEEIADKNRSFTVAVGDMLTDLDFAGLCDYIITPAQSQIAWTLFDITSTS
ncbi:MAG: hypothetical protein SFV17_03330 [Candidatus Obscuribacter sp.]|nr:hypothetical protein [Candidatus Obscuribacter sp.]